MLRKHIEWPYMLWIGCILPRAVLYIVSARQLLYENESSQHSHPVRFEGLRQRNLQDFSLIYTCMHRQLGIFYIFLRINVSILNQAEQPGMILLIEAKDPEKSDE